jgi:hypothetical protein
MVQCHLNLCHLLLASLLLGLLFDLEDGGDVPQKSRLTFTRLRGVTPQRTELFI